jgi:hypothetical protein
MAVVSITAGVILDFSLVPRMITHIILAALWLPLVFAPQVIVLEGYGPGKAIVDSVTFVKRSPGSLVRYISVGFIALLAVTLLETFLGRIFIWEHRIVSLILVSIIILPFLQIYASELYLRRYGLARTR